jgi:hypothetical protein
MAFAQRSPEDEARAYCTRLGLDPDEQVGGRNKYAYGHGDWVIQSRWRWYVGVSDAGLRRPI